jgi:hypothetical protein
MVLLEDYYDQNFVSFAIARGRRRWAPRRFDYGSSFVDGMDDGGQFHVAELPQIVH